MCSTSERVLGEWRGGPKMFNADSLVTGIEMYGGKYANPAEIALREERKYMKDYSASEMKAMQEMSAKFEVNLQGLLESAAAHRAIREREEEQAREVADAARLAERQLRLAEYKRRASPEELEELESIRAFITPFCKARGRDVDELLVDTLVLGPKLKT